MTDPIYKVLIFGGRNWSEFAPIRREVKKLVRKYGTRRLLIIEGGAPGADKMSKIVAHENDVHVAEVNALWDTDRKSVV